MMKRLWNERELHLALRLYCVTPFGRIHSKNPDIIELAATIGRTPSAVALKMVNFASLDPSLSQSGMKNVSALDKRVWTDFLERLHEIEPEEPRSNIGFAEGSDANPDVTGLPGLDAPALIMRRVRQDYFRRMILANYDLRCAATGIDSSEVLVAGHIIPWSVSKENRTNPTNGICLNALFDRAFDRGLIAIGDNLEILYSHRLPRDTVNKMKSIAFESIRLPRRFRPDVEFFRAHREACFDRPAR